MDTQAPQGYFCEWLGYKILGVAARNCNYCNLETYKCSHSGEPCVAKEGLEQFAQSLSNGLNKERFQQLDFLERLFKQPDELVQEQSKPKLTTSYFLQVAAKLENEKRQKIYKEIAKMADHLK
jgi:hypothetical protein